MNLIECKLKIDMLPYKKGDIIQVTTNQYRKMLLLGYIYFDLKGEV